MISSLAQFIATAHPTASTREIGIKAVADCYGCILAGAESDVAQKLWHSLGCFNIGNAPLFGVDKTTSPPFAAMINAAAGHAWDLDDWEEPGNTHPTVVLLPALLGGASVAAENDITISGDDVLNAYCVGAEVIMRLGQAITLSHYERGFHSTATLGALGAAAAVSRLLNLDEHQISNALGFATSQATGYTSQFGSHAKPLQAAWPARAGLESACLALSGLNAKPDTLFSQRGFTGLMGSYDETRIHHMLSRLGQPWGFEQYGLVLKPWPSCGYTHRMMTAAMAVRDRVKDRLNTINSIELSIIDFHYAILPYDIPKTRIEALFSLPACTAQMLVHGELTLKNSEDAFWEESQVKKLVHLTKVESEAPQRPEYNYDPHQPDRIKINFSDGSSLENECAYPLGAAQNPMNDDVHALKFSTTLNKPASWFQDLLLWYLAEDVINFFKVINHD